jgi:uncharacterized protein YjdB
MLRKLTKVQFYSLILLFVVFGVGVLLFYFDTVRRTIKLDESNVIISLSETGWTKNDIELTVRFTGSPIFIKGYSFDGGNTWSRSNMLRVSKNKTINICVKDINDSVYEIEYTINNIDREGPVVLVDNDIKVTRGKQIDLNNYVTAIDKQSGIRDELVFTPNKIDTTKLGTQTIQIYAIDKLANKTISKINVEVVNYPVAVLAREISIDHSFLNLKVGEEDILVATISPKATSNKKIVWTSSNEEVATVDIAGKVTGVSAGTTTISATTSNGKVATCKVVVK